MSNTYRRSREKNALVHLRDSSSDVIDFRRRLMFIEIAKKHPRWDGSIIAALADFKAFWVTMMQKPLEFFSERRMKARLRRVERRLGKH